MYCKNCGTQLPDSAKFCTSCGSKVDESIIVNNEPKIEVREEVPWQLKQNNDFLNDKKDGKILYQNDSFRGKQWNTESKGSIQFGSGEKKNSSFFGKVFKFGIIVVVLIVGYFLIFGDSGPITNVETADAINVETFEPVYPTDLFDDSIPVVYVTFKTSGLDVGQVIQIDWYKADEYLTSASYTVLESDESLAFYMNEPAEGWSTQFVYYADIYLGEELMDTAEFSFEE